MQAVSLCDDVTVRVDGTAENGAENRADENGAAKDRADEDGAADWCLPSNISVSIETDDAFIAGQRIPADGRNTAYRAVEEFFKIGKISGKTLGRAIPREVGVHIYKRIPAGAGLAGGSADAAGALAALNVLCGPLSDADLSAAALNVGADVPFCLKFGVGPNLAFGFGPDPGLGVTLGHGIGAGPGPGGGRPCRTAFAAGVGERLAGLGGRRAACAAVLANPRFEISTAEVFNNFVLPGENELRELSKLTLAMIESIKLSEGAGYGHCFNVLERPATGRYPQIGFIKKRLLETGAFCAAMSGSGPTVYGLFHETGAARAAADAIRKSGYWASVCTTPPA